MVKILDNDKSLPEVKILENISFSDNRGGFNKIFSNQIKNIFDDQIIEVFYSKNKKDVIRGIHFQKDPYQISKIINCVEGKILDFYIDLRKNSLTFGTFSSQVLSSKNNLSVFIPKGFGHGFSVLSNSATVLYLQSGSYIPESEGGINPLSVNFDWQISHPIISNRDSNHPNFTTTNDEMKL